MTVMEARDVIAHALAESTNASIITGRRIADDLIEVIRRDALKYDENLGGLE